MIGKGAPFIKTIYLEPMGKPRMTRRDKWKVRPCVEKYRAFADALRAQVGEIPIADPGAVSWSAYFPMPASWSKAKKDKMRGQPHRVKPDIDNVTKSLHDILFKQDQRIFSGTSEKRWEDGNGVRIVLIIS